MLLVWARPAPRPGIDPPPPLLLLLLLLLQANLPLPDQRMYLAIDLRLQDERQRLAIMAQAQFVSAGEGAGGRGGGGGMTWLHANWQSGVQLTGQLGGQPQLSVGELLSCGADTRRSTYLHHHSLAAKAAHMQSSTQPRQHTAKAGSVCELNARLAACAS